jgi:hypothetical protein
MDFHRPDLEPLRGSRGRGTRADTVTGLVSIDGCRLADSDPLAPLARDCVRSMTEAGPSRASRCPVDPLYGSAATCGA